MSETKAVLRLELANAEQVISELRALKDSLAGLGGGGGATPSLPGNVPTSAAGGEITAIPAMPPAPMSSPVAISPTAAAASTPNAFAAAAQSIQMSMVFGTYGADGLQQRVFDPTVQRFFDPASGAYDLQHFPGFMGGGGGSGGNGGNGSSSPAKPPGIASVAGAVLGGKIALDALTNVANQAIVTSAQAEAQGAPYYRERLIPGGFTAAGAIAGGLIGGLFGSIVPGAGTAIGASMGAGIGATFGGMIGGGTSPKIERDIMNRELAQLGTGDVNFDLTMGGAIRQSIFGGNPLSPGMATRLGVALQKPFKAEGTAAYQRLRYGNAALAVMGAPDYESRDYNAESVADAARVGQFDDPQSAFALFKALGFHNEARGAYDEMIRRRMETMQQEALGTELGTAQTRMQLAGRLYGSDGYAGAMGEVTGNLGSQAAILRGQAARTQNPFQKRQFIAQAQQLEMQQQVVRIGQFDLQTDEYQATNTLRSGRADRAFQGALYAGTGASELPFEARGASMQALAADMEADIAKREAAGLPYSPAEKARMRDQIEGLRFQATTGIAREKEQMIASQKLSGVELVGAQAQAGNIGRILKGSALGQTETFDLQLSQLERQKAVMQEILNTSKLLTKEERMQYETRIENIKASEQQLQVAKDQAESSARQQTFQTGARERQSALNVRNIQGTQSYADVRSIQGGNLELARENTQHLLDEDARLAAKGYSADHPTRQQLRQQIAASKEGEAQATLQMATVPMPDAARGQQALYGAAMSLSQMGYGRFGDVRQNLMGQMGIQADQVKAIRERYNELEAKGELTPAMRANLQEQLAGAVQNYGSLMQQYDEGFDNRIISQAFNMPGRGRLMQSRFTRREAAMAMLQEGLNVPRSFGGPLSLTEQHRNAYPRMMGMLGSGAGGSIFVDRAMSGREPVAVTVNVRVQNETGGNIKVSGKDVSNFSTSKNMSENADAAARKT